MTGGLTRREALGAGAAGAAALAGLTRWRGLTEALAAPPRCGSLADIEHIVIFVQENRSFDHYFGGYGGVRGFADPGARRQADSRTVFEQPGYGAAGFGGHLLPFHLDSFKGMECTHDLTHEWGPQHRSFNGGAMDGFVREHLKAEGATGALTMGYYKREDLALYYALADAFTLCDGYHSSVIGPSDPNHLYLMSGTIDPDGRHGGPIVGNRGPTTYGTLTWTTMAEQLEERGVSWKVYSGPEKLNSVIEDSPWALFKKMLDEPHMRSRAVAPTFPFDLETDIARGELPQVSWVYATQFFSEHPPFPPEWGQTQTDTLLRALTADPKRWAKTLLLITWDENGGFFDHVGPVTAPPGTPGEYLTMPTLPAVAEGIRGPIGLGFRVPLLVVSPFSRGGLVCSDRFDHTSLLRLLETRFGAEVPNLSAWRRSLTGDLTAALNLAATPDTFVPALPRPSLTDDRILTSNCVLVGTTKLGVPLPAPAVPPNSMPAQEPGVPRRPSGPCGVARVRLRVPRDPRRAVAAGRLVVTASVTHGPLHHVVLVLRDARGRVIGRSRPVGISGRRRIGIRLRRALSPGRYTITATARRPDATTLTTTTSLRVPRH